MTNSSDGALLVCDFCGVTANTIHRTVIAENGYNRMRARALYACRKCSDEKNDKRRKNGLS